MIYFYRLVKRLIIAVLLIIVVLFVTLAKPMQLFFCKILFLMVKESNTKVWDHYKNLIKSGKLKGKSIIQWEQL